MIIIDYKNGQKEAVLGETPTDYSLMNREGKIFATMPNNHAKIIYREDVRGAEFVPKVEWDKMVEDGKKAAEEKQKAAEEKKAAEEAARAKAQEDHAKAMLARQEGQARAAANAAWRRKFFITRIFTRKPYPEVG